MAIETNDMGVFDNHSKRVERKRDHWLTHYSTAGWLNCASATPAGVQIKTDSVRSSNNTCKNFLLKIYSQHGNFLNAI